MRLARRRECSIIDSWLRTTPEGRVEVVVDVAAGDYDPSVSRACLLQLGHQPGLTKCLGRLGCAWCVAWLGRAEPEVAGGGEDRDHMLSVAEPAAAQFPSR